MPLEAACNLTPAAAAGSPPPPPLLGANLARFWELAGRPVFEMHGIWWGHHQGAFYRSLPFQLRVDLEPGEIQAILRRSGIWGLSFPTDRPGLPSGHYVLRPEGYDLSAVSRKQRGHVRRGLDRCEFRRLDGDELWREGMDLNRDTLARQSREDPTFLDPRRWKRFARAAGRAAGLTIHGAFVDGRLATYLISCREGEWLHLLYKMSRAADFGFFPNHALDFSIVREAASDPGIHFLGNGMASILPNEGLDQYKRQMGYHLQPHNLGIHLHPWLAPLLQQPGLLALARRARSLFPDSSGLAYRTRILEGALASLAP